MTKRQRPSDIFLDIEAQQELDEQEFDTTEDESGTSLPEYCSTSYLKCLHVFPDFFDDTEAIRPLLLNSNLPPSSLEHSDPPTHDHNVILEEIEALRERSRIMKRRRQGEMPLQMWMLTCSVRFNPCWLQLALTLSRVQGCCLERNRSLPYSSNHRRHFASKDSPDVSMSSAQRFRKLITLDERFQASVMENSMPFPSKIKVLSSLLKRTTGPSLVSLSTIGSEFQAASTQETSVALGPETTTNTMRDRTLSFPLIRS